MSVIIQYYSDGETKEYEGKVLNGKRHGHKGVLYDRNKREIFRGAFKEGKKHGFGTETEFNELENKHSIYTGRYVQDVKEGKGDYIYEDYIRYEGEFKGDNFHGPGTLYDKDGNVWRRGQFEEGILVRGEETRPKGVKLTLFYF